MSDVSEKLRKLAKLNFCEKCYSKYLVLFQGEIEHLLSEPITDWRQAELNIDFMWIKTKNLYDVVNSTVFHPHKNAFQKAKNEKLWKKLKFLKKEGVLPVYSYKLLDKVSKRRNKIHPPDKFSKQDYVMFREVKTLTDTMHILISRDLKDELWQSSLDYVENRAKHLLEKLP